MTDVRGRDELEWEDLVETVTRFLAEQARLGRTPSYTEVNNTIARRSGHRSFDFSQDGERAAMGDLLGRVTHRTYSEIGGMLSAITIYLNENDAGSGFYRLASHMGLLPAKASPDQKFTFWLRMVHRYYGWGST